MSVCPNCDTVIPKGGCNCAITTAVKAERERVARRCAEIAEEFAREVGDDTPYIAHRIREEFGL